MIVIRVFAVLVILVFMHSLADGLMNAYADENAVSMTAPATTNQNRETFVKTMTQSVLATLHDGKKPFVEKQTMLRQTFTNVVDMDWIARFVLGKTWNGSTDAQKAQYTALYHTYLTNTYVSNLSEDSEGKLLDIKILGLNNNDDEDTFVVRTDMVMADSDPVKVDYLVRDDSGQYKVIDIRVEGVSLLATHRSEFAELATTDGISGVIGKLEQMVGRNQPTVALSMK